MEFKRSLYWSVWADCCSLHKKFYGIKESDTTAWEAVLREAKTIRDKYKDSDSGKFAESMILLIVSELENKSKLQKGDDANATKNEQTDTARV